MMTEAAHPIIRKAYFEHVVLRPTITCFNLVISYIYCTCPLYTAQKIYLSPLIA